jgi:hypothetical protein
VFGNPAGYVYKSCDYLLSNTADADNDGTVDSLDLFPADASESVDTDGDGFGDNADPFPQDPTNGADLSWVHCSGEWFTCTVPVPALVRYGIDGKYVYQTVATSIACTNSVFGNPAGYVYKSCDYLLSNTADADNDGTVDSLDLFPADASESADTDGDGLGDNADPFPNDASNAGSANWIFCIGEFGVCHVPIPALVRYGLEGHYFYQQVNDTIECKNSVFGNPVNARKRCDYLVLSTTGNH